jgi:cytochrome c oxidase subunit 4
MSEIVESHAETPAHPGTTVYLIVAGFLVLLTAMELTVFYVHALRPVLVPVLLILSAAKFALVAMFFMHLKYDGWALSTIFIFPLIIAALLLVSLMLLFAYLAHHPG